MKITQLVKMVPDNKCAFFYSWLWLKMYVISEIGVKMHTFGKDQLITPWTMRKWVQVGNAWKQTKLKILMHLSQNLSQDNRWDAQGFPISIYTQKKEDNPTDISILHLPHLHSHVFSQIIDSGFSPNWPLGRFGLVVAISGERDRLFPGRGRPSIII